MRKYHYSVDNLPPQVEQPSNHRFNDLTGKRYGRLFVIYYTGKRGTHKRALTTWLCKCDCGQHLTVSSESKARLKRGWSVEKALTTPVKNNTQAPQ